MKRLSWILAIVFGLVFLGATAMNAALVAKARSALVGVPVAAKAEARSFQIAVILPDTNDSFFKGILDGVSSEAADSDVAVQVFRYAGQSALEADRYFEIALRSKVDGIILYRSRSDVAPAKAGAGKAAEAMRAGVVYIPVGTDAPEGESGPFIGSGSRLQGFEGGKLIGKKLGGRARVGVILAGSGSGLSEEEPLYRGLVTALRGYPDASVVALAEADPGMLSGEAVAESMLRAHSDINAMLCSSAQDTVGVVQVLLDTNKVGAVLVVGADETEDIRRYIDKGVVLASIVRDSNKIGKEAVLTFSRIKKGALVPAPKETGFFVVTGKKVSR
jgi:ribose transport system substrate-binding protein